MHAIGSITHPPCWVFLLAISVCADRMHSQFENCVSRVVLDFCMGICALLQHE